MYMKFKKYLYILLSLIYIDLVFYFSTYDSYLKTTVINVFLFSLIDASLICLLTNLFNKRINKIITYIIYGLKGCWYSVHFIFYKVFLTPFSLSLFKQTDQVLKFGKNVVV